MKKFIPFLFLVAVGYCQPVQRSADLWIVNSDNYPKIQGICQPLTNQTNPWLVFGSQTNVVFQIPASGIIAQQYLGINSNSVIPLSAGGTGGSNGVSARLGLGVNEIATNNASNMKIALGLNGGITTNISVMTSPVLSNSFQFSNGVLTNVAALP